MKEEDPHNPYAVSPATIDGTTRDDHHHPGRPTTSDALYSPGQMFFGAFLGGPLAAAWLMSRNYLVLARADRAKQTLWLGVLVTVLVLMVAFMMPPQVPNAIWPILYSLGIYSYATHQFGEITRQHYAAGGPKPSSWRVVGAGLASVAILMVAMIAFGSMFPSLFD
jgi:hypothetical protein